MKATVIIVAVLLAAAAIAGAALVMGGTGSNQGGSAIEGEDSRIDDTTIDTGEDPSVTNDGDFTVTYVSGTKDAYTISKSNGETKVVFSGITEDTSYSISGTLNGCIVIEAGDYDFELVLNGVTIESSIDVPINVSSGENVDITAKKDTVNYVKDKRSTVSDEGISASIYSKCDLKLKGKGKLVVTSTNNNGIHSKDDLEVKNLTLYVTCMDNALKGNDSVTITSGTVVLNATSGDGIKTTSTDVSSKGVQRGTVTINTDDGDLSLTIRAYCDGIDAAFDVVMEETAGNKLTVDIIAGVGASTTGTLITTEGVPSGPGGMPAQGPGGWGGAPGGDSWMQGGPDSDGNKNKADYSCKGVKADNVVYITSGTITIDSYDDCIHANDTESFESGASAMGDVVITGGTIILNSKDDAIHADGSVSVYSGTVKVTGSYEGLEGSSIMISGGNLSVLSTDDGLNASGTVTISGGKVYIYAGGDGIDSNSRVNYGGIVFSGGETTIISTSGGNSSIDTDYGYTYSGGKVLAICPSGMTQEVTHANTWSSSATYKTMNLSSGSTVTVKVGGSTVMSVTMPLSINNAFVVYLGSNSASISA